MSVIGRPRKFDRDVALDAAMHLFWRKGFLATSMTDLCDVMGIRSPSIYAAFGSKETLYLEAVERYVETVGLNLWGKLAQSKTGRLGVEELLLAAADSLPKSELSPAGCMAALAAVSDEWPAPIDNIAKNVRAAMLSHLQQRLVAAVIEHELPKSTDVDALSRFYLGVYHGMAIQARDGATSVELRSVAIKAVAAWPRSEKVRSLGGRRAP